MTDARMEPSWWRGAVFYQVYVRSWRDTDGDGYGDLKGVIGGLDYLTWLGVDAIWLSPTMPSPDHDWGYDVSDYLGVHPELGALEDIDRLIAAAGERNMRVLLDLVPNHTSTDHAWFVEARQSKNAPHRDWYVWADPAPDGSPPNNWLDASAESAWTLEPTTGQYYLHNFLPTQPDLNWWNPAVHDEFENILRFWFDRGIAGFRIDVAHGIYKDADLRDNPPLPPRSLGGHGGQEQRYSANRPETHELYRQWRKLAEEYESPRLLLGETYVLEVSKLLSFYGQDDELQLAFNFPFIYSSFNARSLAKVVSDTVRGLPEGAAPVWTLSNHDVSRFPTRWCEGDDAKSALALTILLTLPGTAVIYYGDEIGMPDVDVPLEQQHDDMHLGGRGGRPSRDRSRTPMQWDRSALGGFAPPDTIPWLPVGDVLTHNVADEREDPESLLSHCRELIRLRHAYIQGHADVYAELHLTDDLWVYRTGELIVAVNFGNEPVEVAGLSGIVVLSTGVPPGDTSDTRRLAGREALVVRAE